MFVQYYTDPVSGYVFRSLKDAIHYVETGERGQYALGPRKSRIIEMCCLEKESPVSLLSAYQRTCFILCWPLTV